ncbi:nitrilotriacetate monooxygenase [Bradyrhizobium ottawaense]|uniref:NtaA/DmoA family FMN-dependent monooxygenase n=1 Tax=Bradyrhizobium TaxID=374 RepID=UPI000BE88EAB|nr:MULTISPECIES: NtaA/DmoA family FMN-dependent monooxygenase [Bradyrhizobium]MDA9391849.1 nitrilotriacetate monooxygenase [Bradyrhizobium sp. CCBAU 45394]MDA9537355.1 nitrilotriacetate monooxygenase [Bradyrhizobium sp. CCBAU 21362]PDT64713.1 nitrilotriacetate monooxygenase [Bradyrhizobium ottawaense]
MSPTTRTLHLGLNLLGAGGHAASWRWPGTNPSAFFDIEHYVRAAKVAERGLLDAVFLADVPAISLDIARQPPVHGLEPTLILTVIARETRHIGVIGSASTTYNEPYNLARRFQSLDVISGGRAGWNAVTTSSPATVANFGGPQLGREERYRRAEDFVEAVRALWLSWGDGTVVADQASGIYANPAHFRLLDPSKNAFAIRGPLTHPGSPQGHPVIFQAGGSDPGLRLAARSADVVFAAAGDLATARRETERLRALSHQFGRRAAPLVLPGLVTFIGGTEEAAQRRKKQIDALVDLKTAMVTLAQRMNAPVEKLDLDKSIPEELLPDPQTVPFSVGHHRTIETLAREGRTVREIIASVQGVGHRVLAGAPEQIADSIEEWFRTGAVDGFNIMPDVLEDGVPAFVEHVVPILQRRGLFRTEYRGETLREHLGIPITNEPAEKNRDRLIGLMP